MCGLFEVRDLINSEAITGSSLFEGTSYLGWLSYSRKYGMFTYVAPRLSYCVNLAELMEACASVVVYYPVF